MMTKLESYDYESGSYLRFVKVDGGYALMVSDKTGVARYRLDDESAESLARSILQNAEQRKK